MVVGISAIAEVDIIEAFRYVVFGWLVLQLLELSIMSAIVLGLFGIGAWLAKVPEVSLLGDRLLKKFKRA